MLFKGNKALNLVGVFMDAISKLVDRVGDLAKKLRQSIREVKENIGTNKSKKVIEVRYFRQRLNELRSHGPGAHGVQRHEGEVTAKMLDDRCLYGKDPMTGTTTDGVHGRNHGYGKDATKINNPADFVRVFDYIVNSDIYTKKIATKEPRIEVSIPLKDIVGSNFKGRIFGRTRVGTRRKPSHANDTEFPDNTEILALFKKDSDGSYYLYTMFPVIPE